MRWQGREVSLLQAGERRGKEDSDFPRNHVLGFKRGGAVLIVVPVFSVTLML